MARPSESCNTLTLLESQEDYRDYFATLFRSTRKDCAILCDKLDPFIFNDAAIVNGISDLVRQHPKAGVRVLTKNTRDIGKIRLQFLELSRRLTSKISIRKLKTEPQSKQMDYAIGDRELLLVRHNTDDYQGFYNISAKPEAQKLLEEFDYLWERQSADIPDLMTLRI